MDENYWDIDSGAEAYKQSHQASWDPGQPPWV